MLTVKDDGPGVTPENRARLTDRFYRAEGNDTHGSGLGLSIAEKIARAYHGTLSIGAGIDARGLGVTAIYQKRGKVEAFHKSLKSNASLAKLPTQSVTTQNNHVFMSIYAVFRLECLKIRHNANHFALRAKLFIKATQQAYRELQALRAA